MYFSYLLILLGLNQTLMIALLPELAELFSFANDKSELAILTAAINSNLISYWLGTIVWGKYLHRWGFVACCRLTILGFFLASSFVWLTLFYTEQPSLYWLSVGRFILGIFSSAFVVLSHTYLAQKNSANISKLSKNSSMITLGRVLGPTLVLLPITLEQLLLLPIIASLFLSLSCAFNPVTANTAKTIPSAVSNSINAQPISLLLCTALLTTSLVNCLQYFLLPRLIDLGYQGAQASDIFAAILLYLSFAVFAYQLLVIPYLSRYQLYLPKFIIITAIAGGSLLTLANDSWVLLILALSLLAFAISALPNWYSQRAYQSHHHIYIQSQRSAAIARSHSSGHLLGVAIASLSLYLAIPLLAVIWLQLLLLTVFILFINKGALQLSALLTLSTINKDEHEQHQNINR